MHMPTTMTKPTTDSAPKARIGEVMRLLQFGDSAFPVGAFSFSNGLESAVQTGVVADVESLRAFVLVALQRAALVDGVALLAAHRAAESNTLDAIITADHALLRRTLNEEMRTMSVRMGRKLGELSVHILGAPAIASWLDAIKTGACPGTYPVGLGVVFSALGLPMRSAFAAHQYGVAAMMLGAALRQMKVSFLDTQAILWEINASADDAYSRAAAASLDDMASFAPVADILAAIHVRAHVRMFMN